MHKALRWLALPKKSVEALQVHVYLPKHKHPPLPSPHTPPTHAHFLYTSIPPSPPPTHLPHTHPHTTHRVKRSSRRHQYLPPHKLWHHSHTSDVATLHQHLLHPCAWGESSDVIYTYTFPAPFSLRLPLVHHSLLCSLISSFQF